MWMMKLTLCIILLLCTILFSSADAARSSLLGWPAGENLTTFKHKLNMAKTDWHKEDNVTFGLKWYEDKLFFIGTESTGYSSVEILRIINLSGNNVIIVFNYNGFNMYLPFNRINKMYEVKD